MHILIRTRCLGACVKATTSNMLKSNMLQSSKQKMKESHSYKIFPVFPVDLVASTTVSTIL